VFVKINLYSYIYIRLSFFSSHCFKKKVLNFSYLLINFCFQIPTLVVTALCRLFPVILGVARPKRQVIAEELHDEGRVLVGVLV